MVLARLLGPKDFGLMGMVTAFTGFLGVFRDFGLSSAAVQRTTITEEQMSTLFWINILLGLLLMVVAFAMAPAIAAFYRNPQLFWVTAVLASGFLFNAAGIQHSALLQRQMRFTALSMISVVSSIVGIAIGIGEARAGYGYWALVLMTVASPSGYGCISETIASRIAFSRPRARPSTPVATLGIGCSAKPDAFDPCVPIPGSNGSAINQVGITQPLASPRDLPENGLKE
jgi:O-antigen/teichoic acid export membrane protein